MGLSLTSDQNLWKDRALTELNVAVLHSFAASGVTITDHHTESVRFLQHLEREQRQGRACPADWTWIVPPAASSATPVFHRYYRDFDQTPNFYRHPVPARPQPCRHEREACGTRPGYLVPVTSPRRAMSRCPLGRYQVTCRGTARGSRTQVSQRKLNRARTAACTASLMQVARARHRSADVYSPGRPVAATTR
jgi:hypothetical protein